MNYDRECGAMVAQLIPNQLVARSNRVILILSHWLNWLERKTSNLEVMGSTPIWDINQITQAV